jgi:8-oxo-dGTP pyrophosphatase MutT (NUDIX family)
MSIAVDLKGALQQRPDVALLAGDDVSPEGDPVAAAVLVAITDRPEPGLILTVRRDNLRTHAGQVAFPGGRIDPGENAEAAAIREAWEELGLDPTLVEPIAELPTYRTVTGYEVTPLVAIVPPDLPLVPHDAEVADWFEAPLDHVLDPNNQKQQSALFRGRMRHDYEIDWNGRRIWGATAAMLVNLSRLLERG